MRTLPLFPRILILTLIAGLCAGTALRAAPGDLYTIDQSGGPVLRISPNGTKAQFAPGVGSTTSAMAFDRSGNLYICASGAGSILKFAPDATRTTFASGLTSPGALVFDGNGNLFVADGNTIYKFAPNGTRTLFATLSHGVPDMAFDPAGNLFVTQGSDNTVLKLRPDGTSTVFASTVFATAPGGFSNGPFGVAVDGDGNVFVSAFIGGAVYKYTPDGTSRTLFANSPTNNSTGDINFDKSGDLFLNAQGDHAIYKITPNGTKTTFASSLGFATWSAWEPARGNSVNLSTRMRVQTGENALLGGFILTGTAPTTVAIRAIGPSLSRFGIAEALPDPVLELRDNSGALIATNDNAGSTQAAELQSYGMMPLHPSESAMIKTLPPGTYTTVVRDKDGQTGVGLVEVYDLDRTTHSKLGNLSTRGFVEKGGANVMIGGFIIGADGEQVLLRAIGPSLANAGIVHPLADPTLSLFDSNGSLITSNDNWKDNYEVAIRATGIAPANDLESAILTTLTPGAYTAVVQSRDGNTGVALVELYNLN